MFKIFSPLVGLLFMVLFLSGCGTISESVGGLEKSAFPQSWTYAITPMPTGQLDLVSGSFGVSYAFSEIKIYYYPSLAFFKSFTLDSNGDFNESLGNNLCRDGTDNKLRFYMSVRVPGKSESDKAVFASSSVDN